MIQPNEIRIGNLVCNKDNKIIQVNEILSDGINLIDYDGNPEFYFEDLQAISLTENILLKCGFWEEESNSYYHVDFEYIYKDNVGWHIFNRGTKLYIESLHKLQNLHFALTNQELEIEL